MKLSIIFIGMFLSLTMRAHYEIQIIETREPLEAIVAMVNDAYQRVAWKKEHIKRISYNELVAITQHPRQSLYACFDGQKVCGAAFLDYSRQSRLLLVMFSVHPDYQGKSVGSLLLDYVEQEAQQRYHVQELYLHVVPCAQEGLVRYYQRKGYEIVAQEPFLTLAVVKPEYHDQMSLLLMRKKLGSQQLNA